MGQPAGVLPVGSNIVPQVSQTFAAIAADGAIEPSSLKKYLGVKIITIYLDVKIYERTGWD
jgi:hypothetical protein